MMLSNAKWLLREKKIHRDAWAERITHKITLSDVQLRHCSSLTYKLLLSQPWSFKGKDHLITCSNYVDTTVIIPEGYKVPQH